MVPPAVMEGFVDGKLKGEMGGQKKPTKESRKGRYLGKIKNLEGSTGRLRRCQKLASVKPPPPSSSSLLCRREWGLSDQLRGVSCRASAEGKSGS